MTTVPGTFCLRVTAVRVVATTPDSVIRDSVAAAIAVAFTAQLVPGPPLQLAFP